MISSMKLTVNNPPGYTVETMARKLIMALYGKTPVEFIAMLEKEAQEVKTSLTISERGEDMT